MGFPQLRVHRGNGHFRGVKVLRCCPGIKRECHQGNAEKKPKSIGKRWRNLDPGQSRTPPLAWPLVSLVAHHLWETKRDPQASKTRTGQKHKVGCQLGVEPEHLRADVHIQNGRGGRINTVGQPSHVVFGPGTREVGPRSPDSASFPVGLCEAPTALEAGLDADRHGTQLPSAISIEALWSFMGPSQASPNNLKLRGRWSADSSFKRYEGLPRLLSCTRSFPQK